MNSQSTPIELHLPDGIRCIVALSYDLEMCAGYAPDGVNHGRIMPAVQEYTLRLCSVAERYATRLHFFFVCNGFEAEDSRYLSEIIRRGHIIDSHTYSHQHVAKSSPADLDRELKLANRLLKNNLGITSTVLRGPYGYKNGVHNLPVENQKIIINNGFRWVSGEYSDQVYHEERDFWIRAPERDLPHAYPTGLVEIPFQGWSDRMWFDMRPEVDQRILDEWRAEYGHQPVPTGWRPPWSLPHSLDDWITLNLETLDFAYEHGSMWVPVWHPYTHYLHDPECRMLEALLQHARSRPEHTWVCTLRDAAIMLS